MARSNPSPLQLGEAKDGRQAGGQAGRQAEWQVGAGKKKAAGYQGEGGKNPAASLAKGRRSVLAPPSPPHSASRFRLGTDKVDGAGVGGVGECVCFEAPWAGPDRHLNIPVRANTPHRRQRLAKEGLEGSGKGRRQGEIRQGNRGRGGGGIKAMRTYRART